MDYVNICLCVCLWYNSLTKSTYIKLELLHKDISFFLKKKLIFPLLSKIPCLNESDFLLCIQQDIHTLDVKLPSQKQANKIFGFLKIQFCEETL